jgi:DNA-directed RNA polymerase subunit E'/Rpb7
MTQAGMTTLFKPVYLDKRISISPSDLRVAAGNIDEFLVAKIRDGLEGQCCAHGYVRPGSTTILGRSMGQAEHGLFTADFLYHCKVKVSCLLPHADQVVEGRILKVNKSGAYVLLVEDGKLLEAMRILMPRDLHISNSEFEGLQVGQGVRVRILRSRFQANDSFIQAVGEFDSLFAAADGSDDVGILKPMLPDTEAVVTVEPTA